MTNKKNLQSRLRIFESSSGKLSGGFAVLLASEAANVLGGDETNNCHGGNCVEGCGSNLSAGCGHNTNTVAGCGTTKPEVTLH